VRASLRRQLVNSSYCLGSLRAPGLEWLLPHAVWFIVLLVGFDSVFVDTVNGRYLAAVTFATTRSVSMSECRNS